MFKIGQRIVCVKLDNVDQNGCVIPEFMYPKVEEIVIVEGIEADGYLLLKEYNDIDPFFGQVYFNPKCFRPLDEEFAEEVLRKITEEIKEEQLIEIL